MERYRGEARRLYDFMDAFDVACPKCHQKAAITLPNFMDYMNAVLICTHCHFSQKSIELIRYKPTGKAFCTGCHAPLDLDKIQPSKSNTLVYLKCDSCDTNNSIQENLEKIIVKYHTEEVADPVFGLPLWYQTGYKNYILWSFNLDHLTEIRNYVQAGLRERTTDRFKMTMVEKLPNFIKSGKNRESLIKTINKLLEK